MGSGNWIVDNLNSALSTWNGKLAEIWTLISTSPENFKGGGVWSVILNIHGGLQAIGYALSPDYWGRGLMPEVVEELLRFGFTQLGLEEIWCTHYQENSQSRRVIEKTGFTYAFTERLSDEFFPDRPTCFYFMTRDQWERDK